MPRLSQGQHWLGHYLFESKYKEAAQTRFSVPQNMDGQTLENQEHENMETWQQYEQQHEGNTEDSDSHWEEEEADLEYFRKKFRLSHRTYRAPRDPRNERQRFEAHRAEVQKVAEVADLDNVWETTYTPARYEGIFLKDSMQPFFEQDQVVDIMALVKGGKEASVYLCKAHHSVGVDWIAAKVYRPRQFRNLRNDALYREGRNFLTAEDGRPQAVKARDERTARAVKKKTAFGTKVRHTSWLMYEFSTLQELHKAGVPVPMPYGVGENAILMEYIGDERMAAPTLNEVRIDEEEVLPLFETTRQSIATMLQLGFVHGDLSAYNILYWQGEIKLIDFPQVIDTHSNQSAQAVLNRDVMRVCQYFRRYGLQVDHNQLAEELWERYAAPDPDDVAADLSLLADDEAEDALEDEGDGALE